MLKEAYDNVVSSSDFNRKTSDCGSSKRVCLKSPAVLSSHCSTSMFRHVFTQMYLIGVDYLRETLCN